VNRVESFLKTGFPNESNLSLYWKKGTTIVQQRNQPFFTDAHQTTHWEQYQTHVRQAISKQLLDRVCTIILDHNGSGGGGGGYEKNGAVPTTKKPLDWKLCIQALQTLPGIGKFLAWQIACDLQESGCLAIQPPPRRAGKYRDHLPYCELGPGAKRTSFRCF
jgi:hypothetical protein